MFVVGYFENFYYNVEEINDRKNNKKISYIFFLLEGNLSRLDM